MAEDGSDELIFICKYEKGRWFNSHDVTCLLTMFEIKDLNRLSFYFKKCLCKGSSQSLWRSREKVAHFKHTHSPGFVGKHIKRPLNVS